MKTTISHDGFARQSVVREKAQGECAWCGQPAKFRYGIERDDNSRSSMQRRVFCGRSCEKAFNS